MPISLNESLSVFGNSNHLGGFLGHYENGIKANQETEKPLTQAPNYFAWISTASEQVFYRIREMIYVNTEEHGVFDQPYTFLLDYIFENHDPTEEQTESILLFAKIRHLIVHKGFPNPHTAPSENSRNIAKGRAFTSEDVEALAEQLHSPKCYPNLYAKHRIAIKAIDSFEKEFIHDFGFMKISKKR